ncbi:microtubule-associated protein SPIRAL2-like protein [Corchorus olitorius]|uniref:Microtubule-associated protein SPIRAL2-like protein n=1 Tax=Corchorus olitorius TaxID=93759 RepID=A0A1R3KMI0_9ROSI|nr:microtubule-associated protein SPIRAL2-like protein [Corchorus olitorius]
MNMEFYNPAECRAVTQLAMRLHQIFRMRASVLIFNHANLDDEGASEGCSSDGVDMPKGMPKK